jgi:hypothetical protein
MMTLTIRLERRQVKQIKCLVLQEMSCSGLDRPCLYLLSNSHDMVEACRSGTTITLRLILWIVSAESHPVHIILTV